MSSAMKIAWCAKKMPEGLVNKVLLAVLVRCTCSFTMIEVESGTEIEQTLQ